MKKICFVLIVCVLLFFFWVPNVVATGRTNEILNAQSDNLKIADFIRESEQYTKESMPGVDLNEMLKLAITRKYR